MQNLLRIQERHYKMLKEHLYPGDGKEAVAVLLCGRHETNNKNILLSNDIVLIPYDECDRDELYINWKTERVIPFFERVNKHNLGIVKIHSHPGGYDRFSETDDKADAKFFQAAFSWSETESKHASLVMLPDGSIFGRAFSKDLSHSPLSKISVAGDKILSWDNEKDVELDTCFERTIQAFGEGTYRALKRLKVGIIGCSGTGSPTIEQLHRLGVGTIVTIDPQDIEERNLNRIIHSRKHDVGKKKVSVIKSAIADVNLGTKVIAFDKNLFESKEAIDELIDCDIIVGCMDSVDGRHLVSQICNFYLIPYFDLGVRLKADGKGSVGAIVGSINFIKPGYSTLLSRGLYSPERLVSEGMKRTDPETYKELVRRKYIDSVDVDRPAVISINMLISSIAMMELLNRIHDFKDEAPENYARIMVDYCGSCIENNSEAEFEQDEQSKIWAGRGYCKPFLRMPELRL